MMPAHAWLRPCGARSKAHVGNIRLRARRRAGTPVPPDRHGLILSVLCTQPAWFNDLKRRLDGITHKALSEALKRLERHGLISRKVLPTQPSGAEYTITDLGCSLRDPFAALYNWSLANGSAMERAQCAYDTSKGLEG
jgi:DNA-binding HxlR family transcriptional regulator